MKIHLPKLVPSGNRVKVSACVELEGDAVELWYSVEKQYEDFLEVKKLDAFLVGLLVFAMARKEDIYLEGPVSEKLFYHLTRSVMKIQTLLMPSLARINIYPTTLDNGVGRKPATGVATGFSGGIDSFCVLADHFYDTAIEGYRVTHLLLNNVGSHGEGGRGLFWQRYERLRGFAQEHALPLISIDSNLHEIVQMDFRGTHTTRNISAVLALQSLFGKYLYASAHKYENCFIGPSQDASVIDPSALHLFSTELTACISTGCEYSRVEKTAKVAELEPSYRYLDVCVHAVERPENCATCWKCARTLLTLDILGQLQRYEKVFDLDKFKRARPGYVASILKEAGPLEAEVIQLAMDREYVLPSANNSA